MPDNNQRSFIRGAIKIEVNTSTESLIAGSNFTIFVKITNPFDVPIKLQQISTILPTEFVDVDRILRRKRVDRLQRSLRRQQKVMLKLGVMPDSFSSIINKLPLREQIIGPIWRFMTDYLGISLDFNLNEPNEPAIARNISTDTGSFVAQFNYDLLRKVPKNISAKIEKEPDSSEVLRFKKEMINRINELTKKMYVAGSDDKSEKVLQPGNTTSYAFTIRTRRSIVFNPSSYSLKIEVEYVIDDKTSYDTVSHNLNLKSSLSSMILGSVIGGFCGWLARGVNTKIPTIPLLMDLLTALIPAAIAVVFFARRKDVQQIITVEDFWGGIVIGFVAAYAGSKFLETLF